MAFASVHLTSEMLLRISALESVAGILWGFIPQSEAGGCGSEKQKNVKLILSNHTMNYVLCSFSHLSAGMVRDDNMCMWFSIYLTLDNLPDAALCILLLLTTGFKAEHMKNIILNVSVKTIYKLLFICHICYIFININI